MTQQPDPTTSDRESSRDARLARRRARRGDRGVGGIVFGVLLVTLGVIFLLQALDVWTVRGDVVWPLILIALGSAAVLNQVLRRNGTDTE